MATSDSMMIFEKAFRPEESMQVEFAQKIGSLVPALSAAFVRNELIPFMAQWIPRNAPKITAALVENFETFVAVDGALEVLGPVVEALLASENKLIAKLLRKKIGVTEARRGGFEFLSRLLASPLDFVRAFVPRLLTLVEEGNKKEELLAKLISDSAFKVRFEVGYIIPSLARDIAVKVAKQLASDSHSRIRAFLPVVGTKTEFWFSEIAPILLEDFDWSVRASLAKELANSVNIPGSIHICSVLINDGVWRVALCVLASLTKILRNAEVGSSDIITKIFDYLFNIIGYPHISLKNAVIDVFLEIYKMGICDESRVALFVNDIILNQPQVSKLHFLDVVTELKLSPIINLMGPKLHEYAMNLYSSDKWRLRLGIVQRLNTIVALSGDSSIKECINDLCLKSLDDEATPVRIAAEKELAKFFLSENSGKLFPDWYVRLKQADSFRKRQSALSIIKNISLTVTGDDKDKLIEEMKTFEKDSSSNVVSLAQRFIGK